VTTSPNFNNITAAPPRSRSGSTLTRCSVNCSLFAASILTLADATHRKRPMLIAPEIYIEKLDEDE